MKRLYITALLVVATGLAFGQTSPQKPKTDTVPKKAFTVDNNQLVAVTVKVPLGLLGNFVYSENNPGFEAGQLHGYEIVSIQKNKAIMVDSITSVYNSLVNKQYAKFVADTAAVKLQLGKKGKVTKR